MKREIDPIIAGVARAFRAVGMAVAAEMHPERVDAVLRSKAREQNQARRVDAMLKRDRGELILEDRRRLAGTETGGKGRGRSGRRGANDEPPRIPTVEQMADDAFVWSDIVDKRPGGKTVTISHAYRRVPVIDRLFEAGLFTTDEYKALVHYRHHADIVERSLVRDSLNISRGSGGDVPTIVALTAQVIVREIEAAAGQLVDILRAITVEELTLSQWAIRRHGGREKTRVRNGRPCTTIEPSDRALAMAKMEMKMAAQRVEAELAA